MANNHLNPMLIPELLNNLGENACDVMSIFSGHVIITTIRCCSVHVKLKRQFFYSDGYESLNTFNMCKKSVYIFTKIITFFFGVQLQR